MEPLGPWKLIKTGFWVGIGFVVPSVGVYLLGTYLLYAMPSLWQPAAMQEGNAAMEKYMADSDRTSQIKIAQYKAVKNGSQVLILGTIQNTGETAAGSIRLEAELLDDSQQMVFECSEYIARRLAKAETENFQIKCGCANQPVPAYKSLTLRVVQANSY